MRKFSVKRWIFVFMAIVVIAFLVAFLLADFCQAPEITGNTMLWGASLINAPIFEEEEAVLNEESPVLEDSEPSDMAVKIPVLQVSVEDQLDDIAEKLDILQQQVNELMAEVQKEELEEEQEDDLEEQEENDNKIYPVILIFEVKVNPIGERFVKLYNPNDTDVDLTGWYIQRKTKTADSWSSFMSSTNFKGRIIRAKEYFLISRELAGSDVLLDITLSDGNFLALKNPNREIVSEVNCYEDPVVTTSTPPSEDDFVECQNSTDLENIFINEIQIEGETVNDDWVELYNPNEESFCLTGWSI